jgi:Lar family restriction alleviation protein
MSKKRLKPCPFCGGDDMLQAELGEGGYYLTCLACKSRGPAVGGRLGDMQKKIKEACEGWDKRAEASQ